MAMATLAPVCKCGIWSLLWSAAGLLALLHLRANFGVTLQLHKNRRSGRWGAVFRIRSKVREALEEHAPMGLRNFVQRSSVRARGGRFEQQAELDKFDEVEIASLREAHESQRAHLHIRGARAAANGAAALAAPYASAPRHHTYGARNWTTRKHVLDYGAAEHRVFSFEVGPDSTSSCAVDNPAVPGDLLEPVEWVPCPTPSFVTLDRERRILDIACVGEVKVNFRSREEVDVLNSQWRRAYPASGGYQMPPKWTTLTGPLELRMEGQYADVTCAEHGRHGEHNYRSAFVRNEDAAQRARRVFATRPRREQNDAVSVLIIMLDSISRPEMMRALPKTVALLKSLYRNDVHAGPGADQGGEGDGADAPLRRKYKAFLFNRLNSQGGHTAANLFPMYAGVNFESKWDAERTRLHRLTKPVDEWLWHYARRLGYITMQGGDTGNGMMGTRTVLFLFHFCSLLVYIAILSALLYLQLMQVREP